MVFIQCDGNDGSMDVMGRKGFIPCDGSDGLDGSDGSDGLDGCDRPCGFGGSEIALMV